MLPTEYQSRPLTPEEEAALLAASGGGLSPTPVAPPAGQVAVAPGATQTTAPAAPPPEYVAPPPPTAMEAGAALGMGGYEGDPAIVYDQQQAAAPAPGLGAVQTTVPQQYTAAPAPDPTRPTGMLVGADAAPAPMRVGADAAPTPSASGYYGGLRSSEFADSMTPGRTRQSVLYPAADAPYRGAAEFNGAEAALPRPLGATTTTLPSRRGREMRGDVVGRDPTPPYAEAGLATEGAIPLGGQPFVLPRHRAMPPEGYGGNWSPTSSMTPGPPSRPGTQILPTNDLAPAPTYGFTPGVLPSDAELAAGTHLAALPTGGTTSDGAPAWSMDWGVPAYLPRRVPERTPTTTDEPGAFDAAPAFIEEVVKPNITEPLTRLDPMFGNAATAVTQRREDLREQERAANQGRTPRTPDEQQARDERRAQRVTPETPAITGAVPGYAATNPESPATQPAAAEPSWRDRLGGWIQSEVVEPGTRPDADITNVIERIPAAPGAVGSTAPTRPYPSAQPGDYSASTMPPERIAAMPSTEVDKVIGSMGPRANSVLTWGEDGKGNPATPGTVAYLSDGTPIGYSDGTSFVGAGSEVLMPEFEAKVAAARGGTASGGQAPSTSGTGSMPTGTPAGTGDQRTLQPAQNTQTTTSTGRTSGGGGGYTPRSGGGGGYTPSGGGSSSTGSSRRGSSVGEMFDEDDDFGLNERDFTEKDYDGDGKISAKDRSVGRKRYQSELSKRRKKKGKTTSFSNVPQREDSPIRTKVLSAIDQSVNKKKKQR